MNLPPKKPKPHKYFCFVVCDHVERRKYEDLEIEPFLQDIATITYNITDLLNKYQLKKEEKAIRML